MSNEKGIQLTGRVFIVIFRISYGIIYKHKEAIKGLRFLDGGKVSMKQKIAACVHDIIYCLKLSLKIALIPVSIGIIGTIGYLLIKGEPVELIRILMGVRNVGIVFSCIGLFICGLGFLQPLKLLRPLSYHNTWQNYFRQFGLVGAMFCISGFMTAYFLGLDVIIYYWIL